ncbi:hypothetical protein NDU88_013348, partial [Pleurodeles waltl]
GGGRLPSDVKGGGGGFPTDVKVVGSPPMSKGGRGSPLMSEGGRLPTDVRGSEG